MSELLPCPFCGGEAQILNAADKPNPGAWRVNCINLARCGIPDTFWHESKKLAVEAWNTRTPDPLTQKPDKTCELCGTPVIHNKSGEGTQSYTPVAQHNFCEKHSEDEIDGCCNCLLEKVDDEITAMRKVVEAAIGICQGFDWNNGTHAKEHRYKQKLRDAVTGYQEANKAT